MLGLFHTFYLNQVTMNQSFLQPNLQDIMLAVNVLQNTEMSNVDICTKCGISCSHYIVTDWVEYVMYRSLCDTVC